MKKELIPIEELIRTVKSRLSRGGQAKLADQLDVSPQAVSQALRGDPAMEKLLVKIAEHVLREPVEIVHQYRIGR